MTGEERSSNYWILFKDPQRLKEKSRGRERSGGLESGEHRQNERKGRERERKTEDTRGVIG